MFFVQFLDFIVVINNLVECKCNEVGTKHVMKDNMIKAIKKHKLVVKIHKLVVKIHKFFMVNLNNVFMNSIKYHQVSMKLLFDFI